MDPAASIKVCCGECQRPYTEVADIPVVRIVNVVEITIPDEVFNPESSWIDSTDSPYIFSDFDPSNVLDRLNGGASEVYAVATRTQQNVKITKTSGAHQGYIIHFEIGVAVREAAKKVRDVFPFREDWTGKPSNGVAAMNFKPAASMFEISKSLFSLGGAMYVRIAGLKWSSVSHGCFSVGIETDGPNFGSAGGPSFTPVLSIYRVNFERVMK